jgi:hypothetical protein
VTIISVTGVTISTEKEKKKKEKIIIIIIIIIIPNSWILGPLGHWKS